MEFITEKNRIYAADDEGRVLAEVTFPDIRDGVVEINRTFVGPELRGSGAAEKLLEHAYIAIKNEGKKAELTCNYAIKWFEKRDEKRDILANR
jgi:predicted GNAT family acetyltransferase